jgi:hypothetical protein
VIRTGETHVNPVSGETITFIETAADTNGEYTLIEVSVVPGGGVPMAHTHLALAVDGKLNKRGLPSPVRLATIANAYFGDSRAPYIPAWMQKAGLATGAALGRTFGYEPTYDRQTPAPQLVPATA